MKYLVVIQIDSDIKNATIFDSLTEAKRHLVSISLASTDPALIKWENDECLMVKTENAEWAKIFIIRTERAEYRLIRHIQGEADEERRFSFKENAIGFVAQRIDTLPIEDAYGDWTNDLTRGSIYKLYAVILDSEEGSLTVKKRFNAAESTCLLFGIIKKEETKNEKKYKSTDATIDEIAKTLNKQQKTIRTKKKKKIIVAILSSCIIAAGIFCLTADWQMISDEIKASHFSPTEEVKALADSIHLTRKGRAAYFASQPILLSKKDFNNLCGRDGSGVFTAGCYYKNPDNGDEYIWVYDVGTSTINENGLSYSFAEYRKSVTLHETLHAIWERQNDNKKNSICGDLKTISNQISKLKKELSLYNNSSLCTELFARVGSEYAPILAKNSLPISTTSVPASYSSLDNNGKMAIERLLIVYNDYFDTKENSWLIKYWQNEKNFETFESKVVNLLNDLATKKKRAIALINQYNSWPTWGRRNSAYNAINEFNNALTNCKKYVATYNKVYSVLDSEHSVSTGDYLNL